MRVLYVYQGDWPRNATRPRKQTMALAEAGHVVRLHEGDEFAFADVEERVPDRATGLGLDGFTDDRRKAEHVLVEIEGALHVVGRQADMTDSLIHG